MSLWRQKCYNIKNNFKFLRRIKVNGSDFILRGYSGRIFFQNTSPIEKNEDYFILTWNSGYIFTFPDGSEFVWVVLNAFKICQFLKFHNQICALFLDMNQYFHLWGYCFLCIINVCTSLQV